MGVPDRCIRCGCPLCYEGQTGTSYLYRCVGCGRHSAVSRPTFEDFADAIERAEAKVRADLLMDLYPPA